MVDNTYGAAARAAIRELGGIFTPQVTPVAIGVNAVPVVPYNPNRIGLVIVNTGTSIITLSPLPNPTTGVGLLLITNGSSISLNWHDDGDVVASNFYGIGSAAGGSVFVFEEIQASIYEA